MSRFLGALQFLTIVPIRGRTSSPGEAAIFFPLVGALLGAGAGVVCRLGGAVMALGFLALITGCLHEDGLADVADAIRAGRTQEKMLSILKDSRIGTYGAMALIVAFALRWQALTHIRMNPVYALAGALALSRSMMVMLAAFTPAVGEGMGVAFARQLTRPVVVGVAFQAVAIAFIAGWRLAITLVLASALTLLLARSWFIRRLGGVNGDCLGATCQAVETINLVILTWQPSF